MLTRVEATSSQGVTLSLPLADTSSGFSVKPIEGLDPVKATIVSSSFAHMDGSQYQASRREARNIVLKLGYEPDFASGSMRTLRDKLYSIFMPKSTVTLKFYDDELPVVQILAMVEDFSSPLFTKDPEVSLSMICFDPDFITPTETTVNGLTTSGTDEIIIDYNGTVETGVKLKLSANRAMDGFTVYQRSLAGATSSLAFASTLASGDVVDISTISGAKSATLTRATVVSSILYGVSPYAAWINLVPGRNYIRVFATGNIPYVAVPYTIKYATRYGGL